ncbi:hypothetical protein B0H11DRAFT_2264458 [Mycena galericulata]|nr:hypothetical protein B0H11DRAFT_2264458 [Mycena galericulata]
MPAKKIPVAAGKEPRRKRVRKKVGVKPGKISWIHGTKETFFASRTKEWTAAMAQGQVALGKFYTKVTNLYVLKYGYDLADDEDLDEDTPDPTDPDAIIPGSDKLSKEEADKRTEYRAVQRKRIAAWYNRKNRGVDENDKSIFAELLGGFTSAGPGRPRRAQPLHYYSRLFYEDRVKARFEAAFAAEVQRAKDLELEEEPKELPIRNEITKQVFSEETEQFQAELKLGIEAEYVAAVRAWELTRAETPTKTPEELSAALKNAGYYLEPLAQAVRDKFGMNCSILLCGPIGDRGGAIEVRSVHAGTTRGLAPQKWYLFDPMGYDAVEKSMVKFSTKCFSDEECRERIVKDSEQDASSGPAVPATGGASRSTARTEGEGGDTPQNDASAVNGDTGRLRTSTGDSNPNGNATSPPPESPPRAPSPPPESPPRAPSPDRVATPDAEPASGQHRVWTREGSGKWPKEMKAAFGAFAVGEKWGTTWAELVETWVDVEEAAGRPAEIGEFLKGGRKWYHPPTVRNVGKLGLEGSFVDRWWKWWRAIQPPEQEMTWGNLPKMHGRTGFMLVLASLMWWGLASQGGAYAGPYAEPSMEWWRAVGEVKFLLTALLKSGEIVGKKGKTSTVATKTKPIKKVAEKRKRVEDDEEEEEEEEGGESARKKQPKRQRRGKEESGEARKTRSKASVEVVERPRPRPVRSTRK